MKKIQHFFLFFLIFLLSIALASCTSSNLKDYAGGSSPEGYAPDADFDSSFKGDFGTGDSYAPTEPDFSEDASDEKIPDEEQNEVPKPLAGQITSSAWSDHKNYDFWTNLFKSDQENNKGLFSDFFTTLNSYNNSINTQKMIKVKITNNTIPAINTEVIIKNDNYSFKALTNVNGIAYLFLPVEPVFPYIIEYNNESYKLEEYSSETIELTTSTSPQEISNYNLDLMFVVDTTGSMGDELNYLKEEIKDVIERIDTDQKIRLSLLFYRDEGDQYVTNFFDFTTNINEQINNINLQKSSGGGDFEEAVDVALNLGITQGSWNDYSNKILIHVLDAPPHSTKQNLNLFANSLLTAAQKGIRIIPVASSGINKWTEFLLRTEALITGGTYTYITNHSGIGGDHIDATVGTVIVEYLNDMLVRLINEYYTGIETTPIPYDQVQNKKGA